MRSSAISLAPPQGFDYASIEQAARGGKSHRHLEFNAGDGVLRRVPPLNNAICCLAVSLAPMWEGPYDVTTQVSRLTYRLTRLSINELSERDYIADLKGYLLRDQNMGSILL